MANSYCILDLIKLLHSKRGDRVLLEAGTSPTLIIKGELHKIEGPS